MVNLYDKLSIGGYIIIDDYSFAACAKAVNVYRNANNITEDIIPIDKTGIYWKKVNN